MPYFFSLFIVFFSCFIVSAQKTDVLMDTIMLDANSPILFSPKTFLNKEDLLEGHPFPIQVIEEVRSVNGTTCISKGQASFAVVEKIDNIYLYYCLNNKVSTVGKNQICLNSNSLRGKFKFTDSPNGKGVDNAVGCIAYTTKEERIIIPRKCPGKELSKRRLALVIGNANYKTNQLINPINDARDMAEILFQFGFDTLYRENINIFGVLDAMEAFRDSLDKKRYDVGFVYYSGHGIEIDKKVYLVPLDAKITRSCYVRKQCVEVTELLEEMPVPLKIIVFDACRDNPFESKPAHTKSTMEVVTPVERVDFDSPRPGVLLVYATSSGKTADDIDSVLPRNSPYTGRLKSCFQEKEIAFPDVFGCVQEQIKTAQTPESVSSFGRYYLRW